MIGRRRHGQRRRWRTSFWTRLPSHHDFIIVRTPNDSGQANARAQTVEAVEIQEDVKPSHNPPDLPQAPLDGAGGSVYEAIATVGCAIPGPKRKNKPKFDNNIEEILPDDYWSPTRTITQDLRPDLSTPEQGAYRCWSTVRRQQEISRIEAQIQAWRIASALCRDAYREEDRPFHLPELILQGGG